MTSLTKPTAAYDRLPLLLPLLSLITLALLPTAEAVYYSSRVYVGYYYTGYYYTGYYFSVGGIVGSAIGALCFTGFVVAFFVFFCCIRKRRMMAAQQRRGAQVPIALGAPVSSVSGQVVAGGGSYMYPKPGPQPDGSLHAPPPYPTAAAAGNNNNNNGYMQPPLPSSGAVNAGYYGDYSNLPNQQQQQQPWQAPPPYQPDAARF